MMAGMGRGPAPACPATQGDDARPGASGPENIVVKRTARSPRLPHANWWRPGVYASGPAVLLWIAARLPAPWLADLFNLPNVAALLNHGGDTVFVAGWLASAAWLWFTRRRDAAPQDPRQSQADAAAEPHDHTPHRAG